MLFSMARPRVMLAAASLPSRIASSSYSLSSGQALSCSSNGTWM